MNTELSINKLDGYIKASFSAMASPCDVLMETDDEQLARRILHTVSAEAWRIEQKFSRYREENIVYRLNHSAGQPVEVDDETDRLLSFANELYELSEGLFDITSGVLRRVWRFDGSDKLPDPQAVKRIVRHIGWDKIERHQNRVCVPREMEIDLGGIGKEYAVDRSIQLVRSLTDHSVLINFGGDLAVTTRRQDDSCWAVGRLVTGSDDAKGFFQLYCGAIATSGDANRYLLKDGVRYSHILNPKTGWPIEGSPHTISVAAPTCIEAGMMSTLAMLQGKDAETFLKMQEVNYWID